MPWNGGLTPGPSSEALHTLRVVQPSARAPGIAPRMFDSFRTLFAPLAVLLLTACGSTAVPEASNQEDHEALRGAIAEVKADTGVTKTNTEFLKVGLTSAQQEFTELGTALNTSLTGLKTDLTTVKSGAETLQTVASSVVTNTTALQSSVTALHTQLSAARRYSKTCNPATDTWLRAAWPGLSSDAEITDACRRDGRWHYLGTLLDFIKRTITLPDGMELGLSSYANQINATTVNGWEFGTRFCISPIAVGNATGVDGAALIHECIAIMDNRFTVTHALVNDTAAPTTSRDYSNHTTGSEFSLPCFSTGGGYASCNNNESIASFWKVYVRQ